MEALRSHVRTLAVGVVAFALATVGAGGSLAASDPAARLAASATQTIRACVKATGPQKGLMRHIATGTCARGETALTWNVTGPPGPTGQGVATHLLSGEVHVYAGANMTVSLTCVGDSILGWTVERPSGGADLVYAEAVTGLPRGMSGTMTAQQTSLGHIWRPETYPGPAEAWFAAGGEAFHVRFITTDNAADGSCKYFATY